MFRQYGGLFSNAEKELALKRITNSRLHTIVCQPVQQLDKPVVVPFASKQMLLIASQEESNQFASKEELLFTSQEKSNKGSIPAVVVPMEFGFILPVVKSTTPVVVPMEQNATIVNFSTPAVVVPARKNDGRGHQSSVVVASQQRSSSQLADVSKNGVVNNSWTNARSQTNQWISCCTSPTSAASHSQAISTMKNVIQKSLPMNFLNLKSKSIA